MYYSKKLKQINLHKTLLIKRKSIHSTTFKWFLFVGESRFVSDLNVLKRRRHRRRHPHSSCNCEENDEIGDGIVQERIAFRLAHPIPSSNSTSLRTCSANNVTTNSPSTAVVVKEFVQSATVNVPLSPFIPRDTDSNDTIIMKDLPKCLMQSHGNVFD